MLIVPKEKGSYFKLGHLNIRFSAMLLRELSAKYFLIPLTISSVTQKNYLQFKLHNAIALNLAQKKGVKYASIVYLRILPKMVSF